MYHAAAAPGSSGTLRTVSEEREELLPFAAGLVAGQAWKGERGTSHRRGRELLLVEEEKEEP